MKISLAVVVGLAIAHPQTWKVELSKIEYSILKEAIRTDNWGQQPHFQTVTA